MAPSPDPSAGPNSPVSGAWETLEVASFAELVEFEQRILGRIAELPNGGYLFLLHPLMLLDEIAVQLSDAARAELLRREPDLANLSPLPYVALRSSQEPQTLHCHLSGLFARDSG